MLIDLNGKVIVITGASKGIGRELAKTFAKNRAKVVINYLHSEREAKELLEEINDYNKECIAIKADVTKYADVLNMYHLIWKEYGTVDVLINNAGRCNDNLIQFMSEEQWKNIIDVNLTGAFYCSKVFLKGMVKQKKGKIINISSLKGQEGCEGQTNYAVSKGGMIGLTKSLAKENGKFNILVNAVCPGFIITDLNRYSCDKIITASDKSIISIEHNLNDLINFLVLFCSDKIKGISGRVFNLDSRIK